MKARMGLKVEQRTQVFTSHQNNNIFHTDSFSHSYYITCLAIKRVGSVQLPGPHPRNEAHGECSFLKTHRKSLLSWEPPLIRGDGTGGMLFEKITLT